VNQRERHLLRVLLLAIVESGGRSPTYEELGRRLGWSSKASVHRAVHGLVRRGLARLIPKTKRSVEPLVMPELTQRFLIAASRHADLLEGKPDVKGFDKTAEELIAARNQWREALRDLAHRVGQGDIEDLARGAPHAAQRGHGGAGAATTVAG
jgi:SOS-response transcriptional repressor LexA